VNWDDLRFFLALAREGTVSGAGRLLEVKHTTVARRITAFEEQLGSRLFDRTPSGYVLTQVGENLLPHSMNVEELMNSVDREVFGMDYDLNGPLKLASSYDILTNLITPHLHHFTKKYPDIELSVVSSTSLVDLRSREADIALRISPNPPEYLIGRKIMPLGHGVYASTKYLKTKKNQGNLILWESDKTIPQWANDLFPKTKVKMRTSEIMTMVEAVKNHHGYARIPCYVADAIPSLRRIDIKLKPSNWNMWVLSHPDLKSTARVRACKEFLIDTIEKQRSLIEGTDSKYA